MQILGIDVGGTGIKSAIVETSTGELVSERHRIDTPRPATPKAVGEALKEVLALHRWKGPVGMGFPAAIQHGIARTASNIDKSFIGLPIAEYFTKQTGSTFYLANDAAGAVMAIALPSPGEKNGLTGPQVRSALERYRAETGACRSAGGRRRRPRRWRRGSRRVRRRARSSARRRPPFCWRA